MHFQVRVELAKQSLSQWELDFVMGLEHFSFFSKLKSDPPRDLSGDHRGLLPPFLEAKRLYPWGHFSALLPGWLTPLMLSRSSVVLAYCRGRRRPLVTTTKTTRTTRMRRERERRGQWRWWIMRHCHQYVGGKKLVFSSLFAYFVSFSVRRLSVPWRKTRRAACSIVGSRTGSTVRTRIVSAFEMKTL